MAGPLLGLPVCSRIPASSRALAVPVPSRPCQRPLDPPANPGHLPLSLSSAPTPGTVSASVIAQAGTQVSPEPQQPPSPPHQLLSPLPFWLCALAVPWVLLVPGYHPPTNLFQDAGHTDPWVPLRPCQSPTEPLWSPGTLGETPETLQRSGPWILPTPLPPMQSFMQPACCKPLVRSCDPLLCDWGPSTLSVILWSLLSASPTQRPTVPGTPHLRPQAALPSPSPRLLCPKDKDKDI